MTIREIEEQISPLDEKSMEQARQRWLSVAKPLFSLGKLEDVVIRMAGIKRTADYELKKKGLIIMCADNGVVAEGVTQTGSEVTAQVADNFTKGEASTCIMAQVAGVDVFPIDIGMCTQVPSVTKKEYKVACGTRNLAKEPAMTRDEVLRAIWTGIRLVKEKKEEGYDILATGEMGIGNTTTSSAVAAVLLNRKVEEVTGKGAGLTSQGLARKIRVIRQAIEMHRPDRDDVIDVLSKVGGLDIAALVGVFLGGAMQRVPVVIDGFISAVAALCAVRLIPAAADYILPSHVSREPAGQMVLDALGMSPFLTCDMCLGEGSGAVAVMPLLEMGLQVYRQMGTFGEMDIEQYQVLK
ncbi:nicotinate-nucleotide--dimethylbenzimidazole phosphoribosyltransferase [Roseburia hominis]